MITDSVRPVSGYSAGTVLHSGTMMDFALRLVKIGELYMKKGRTLHFQSNQILIKQFRSGLRRYRRNGNGFSFPKQIPSANQLLFAFP